MSNNQNEKSEPQVGGTVSLKGLVKGIFGNIAHVQIGGKIIPINVKDIKLDA